MPTCTTAPVTVASPVAPLMGVGPAADKVHAVGGVVAPVSPLSTTFTNVNVGATAVLVISQITFPPGGTVVCPSAVTGAPWHTHVPPSNPGGPVSSSWYVPLNTVTWLTPPAEVGSPLPETTPCPGIVAGVAVSVQSAGTLPDPLSAASTILRNVSFAGWSSLWIVHVA